MIRDTDRFDESAAESHERVFKSDGRYVFARAGSSLLPQRDDIDGIASKRPTSRTKVWGQQVWPIEIPKTHMSLYVTYALLIIF